MKYYELCNMREWKHICKYSLKYHISLIEHTKGLVRHLNRQSDPVYYVLKITLS